jgi:DNA-binding transcriptional LysR family regulator
VKHLRTLTYISDIARSGSIRRSAERLNVTPSALTRKIQDFEQEIGTPVFERLAQGMRLNAAGEMLVRHIRSQVADFERLRSQIADLAGLRRGHVAIASSQAFVDQVLPLEIAAYRRQFPYVTFAVEVRDHALGVASLAGFETELALLLAPPPAPEMRVLLSGRQPLCAMMRADHPLARGPKNADLRLRDCFRHPVAMPDRSLAVRHLLDAALARKPQPADVRIESGSIEFLRNYVVAEHVVSFQIAVGIPPSAPGLLARPIDPRDITPIDVVLGQSRGRTLTVAAAKFVDQLSKNPLWR